MSSLPHSRLFLAAKNAVVISGPHIQLVDSQTGEVVKSTATFEGADQDAILKSGPIRCADIDVSFTHLVTSGEDKQLKVWRLEDLKLLSTREIPKKPTDVHLTRDGQTILVSDKFGDIFSYPIQCDTSSSRKETPVNAGDTNPRSQIVSHENPSGGTLILGHTSLLTSFVLTDDEKYIISADRDEHIRVSWYPQGFVIERFCLGHKKFVHTVHVPKFAPSMLISGGGDPVLKLWDWMSGELLYNIKVGEVIEPFITVRAVKGKWGRNEGNGDAEEEVKVGKRKGRKGRGKRKEKAEEEDLEQDADEARIVREAADEDVTMQDPDAGDEPTVDFVNDSVNDERSKAMEDPLVLVVHRVASVDIPDQGQFLVFNAVGATAMFYCTIQPDSKSAEAPAVHSLQLGKPIIDFTIDKEGRIWTLVDGEKETHLPVTQNIVRLLSWSSGQLVEEPHLDESNQLLQSLNTSCKIPATSEDLRALDVYSALSAMPKHVDPDHDPFEGSGTAADQTLGKRKAKEPTQREQARMRKKLAVIAKLQEQAQTGEPGSREASLSIPPEDERDVRKTKAEDDAEANL